MNSTQRKFLVERIQQKVKARIEDLRNTQLRCPSASNFIFKAILNGELKLQESDVILSALREKALKAKEGENWLSEERMGMNRERTVLLKIQELVILPKDFNDEMARVIAHNAKIKEEIALLEVQLDTIEVRVQLASDKTLQNLINEVDDMGNLSLMDTKLKLLSNG